MYAGVALRRLNKWRETHGLETWDMEQVMHMWGGEMEDVWVLECVSEAVVGRGWGGGVVPVGCVMDRGEGRKGWGGEWNGVQRWVDAAEGRLDGWCVTRGLGRRVGEKVMGALRVAGVSRVLVFGEGVWGGGGRQAREWMGRCVSVSKEKVPAGWLYRRVSAVVCGGGRDEVLACVEMGVPCVVVGAGGEGAVWARLVARLGVGVAVGDAAAPAEFVEGVRAVGGAECRRRAAELGCRVRAEGAGRERAAAKVREIVESKGYKSW